MTVSTQGSPDGQTLAFVAVPKSGGPKRLFIRRLGELQPTALAGVGTRRTEEGLVVVPHGFEERKRLVPTKECCARTSCALRLTANALAKIVCL